MYTNLEIYRSIAVEALEAAQRAAAKYSRPKPDGMEGSIISFDPARTSFKQSMIAIAFAGMYLDALLFVEGTRRLGRATYLGLEREYEQRLKRIALVGDDLLERCAAFRAARNELVHEKAADNLQDQTLRLAQKEAVKAITLIRDVASALGHPWTEQ